MRKQNQCMKILKHLKTHKRGITPLEALEKYGIMRLGARIYDLRERGNNIVNVWDQHTDEDGETVRFARYILR